MMKKFFVFLLIFTVTGLAFAGPTQGPVSKPPADKMEVRDLKEMQRDLDDFLRREIGKHSDALPFEESAPQTDSLSANETYLPNKAKPKLSKKERWLLVAYMENPSDPHLAKVMAAYHVLKSGALKFSHGSPDKNVNQIKHAIYAKYFISRAGVLGESASWLARADLRLEKLLSELLPVDRPLDLTEGNASHQVFLEAFNYTEENRYKAEQHLLKDLLKNPTNLTTNLYASSVNLWNAGEANYADPAVLYSFLKASYFAKRVTGLSQRVEREWEADPENKQLYRLAPAVGGFSLPSRRWLAKFHGDHEAVKLLDKEVDAWLQKYPQFYLFPASVYAFTEPENFMTGFSALLAGMDACGQNNVVFCQDLPRATYNNMSFFILAFDYFVKLGDLDSARNFLSLRYVPVFRYDTWYLGFKAWELRENNIEELAALYQNDDPADDPINGFLKRHKWGPESSTCQLCHQVQGAYWTEEEKNTIHALDEELQYVKDWPVPEVDWDTTIIP